MKTKRAITAALIFLSLQEGAIHKSRGGPPYDDARRPVVAGTSRRKAQNTTPSRETHSTGSRSQMWEPVNGVTGSKPERRASLFKAICTVESNNDPTKYNEEEKAAGIAQIRPICVKDVNRILGCVRYSLRDRYSVSKALDMFDIYTNHYARSGEAEEMARVWNGGPKGMSKNSTMKYWLKVRLVMEGL